MANHIDVIRYIDGKEYVELRHGHWDESDEDGTLFCSQCGRPTYDRHDVFKEFMGMKIIALSFPYYCGYCGAKMDEEIE